MGKRESMLPASSPTKLMSRYTQGGYNHLLTQEPQITDPNGAIVPSQANPGHSSERTLAAGVFEIWFEVLWCRHGNTC